MLPWGSFLVCWDVVYTSRLYGDLGILNIRMFNQASLAKWILCLLPDPMAHLSQVVRHKYYHRIRVDDLALYSLRRLCHVWNGVIHVMLTFILLRNILRNGGSTRISTDARLGNKPLVADYPSLFEICAIIKVTIASMVDR